jgi:hypothetical protein
MKFTVTILVDILPLKKTSKENPRLQNVQICFRVALEITSFPMWGTDGNPGIFSGGDGPPFLLILIIIWILTVEIWLHTSGLILGPRRASAKRRRISRCLLIHGTH